EIIQRNQRGDAGVVLASDLRERIARRDGVEHVRKLLRVVSIARQRRHQLRQGRLEQAARQAQLVLPRQVFASLPYGRLQRRVVACQFRLADAQRLGKGIGREVGIEDDRFIVHRRVWLKPGEVLLGIPVYLQGSQKSDIEASGSEAKSPAAILPQDLDVGGITVRLHGAT